MRKRFLGLLMACCMVFSLAMPVSYAAGDGGLVVGTGSVKVGDTETLIPITIEKTGSAGLTLLNFKVQFPEQLELTAKPTVGTLFKDQGTHSNVFTSPYIIALGDDLSLDNVTDAGVVLTLNFKVKAGTKAGDYPITLIDLNNMDADLAPVNLTVTAGKITVEDTTPAATTHAVTIAPSQNGTVTADKTTAAKDETVKLTVAPASGYELATLTVDSKDVTASVSKNTYSFTMPDKDVAVSATFKAVEAAPTTYNVTVASSQNGSVTANPGQAASGANVTLTVAPASGYELATLTVDGTDVAASVSNNTYSFTMPDKDVAVSATFKAVEAAPITYNVTVASSQNGSVTASSAQAASGATVTLTITPASNFELASLVVDGVDQAAKVERDYRGALTYSFAMPAHDVTVTPSFKAAENTNPPAATYAVILADSDNGMVSTDKVTAAKDELVTLTITPDNNYALSALTVDGEDVTASVRNNTYSFTMPDHNVNVYAGFYMNNGGSESSSYGVQIDRTITNGTVTVSQNDSGLVYLTITPASNYELAALTVDGENVTKDVEMMGGALTYVLSLAGKEYDVYVTAAFKAVAAAPDYAVNIAASIANGTVTADKTAAKANDAVVLTVTPAANYELASLSVDGEDVTGNVSSGRYSFVMPSHDVSVTATFRAIDNSGTGGGGGGGTSGGGGGTLPEESTTPTGGCYVATSVYGSYDAPEVWTLRQYRDEVLGSTWYGRLFIKAYYAASPTLVKWFGNTEWFQNFFRARLDQMVDGLQAEGFTSAPYEDINW